MEHAIAMHMEGQRVNVFEFSGVVLLHIVPQCFAGAFGVLHHEGQLKHFHQGEAASGVAGQGPNHIDDAVFNLVKQLRRRATQLHGRVNLALEPIARIQGDAVAPGLDKHGLRIRARRQKVMHL